MNDYSDVEPIALPVPADRQGAKRHYGVHPYFTRRPANVVRKYVLHYSRQREVVADPFGGSGVTAIEAFLENRVGIQNDINPLANFIAQGIVDLAKGNSADYRGALEFVKARCETTLARISGMDDVELTEIRRTVRLPEIVRLPSNSDVDFYHDLFSPRQLVALALLRDAVDSIPQLEARKGMLMAWSATLTKLNKTFLSAHGRAESRGGSSIFSIYRYKVAKTPVELPPWKTFAERAVNIIRAKAEIDRAIEIKRRTDGWLGQFKAYSLDIEELSRELEGKVDYIFTDPPYGGHISYLDLSTLWNVWLGQQPTPEARKRELIVGGELEHSESAYVERLGRSIAACLRMLKPGRWLSVVFQHWNPQYFEAILSSAAAGGAELKAALSQVGDPIWSMHKKKGSQSVLAGEMILTFRKTGVHSGVREGKGLDVPSTLRRILASQSGKVYGEYIFNQLIMEGWRNSAMRSLNISRDEFIGLLTDQGWEYDDRSHAWIRKRDVSATLFSSAQE